MDIKKDDFNAWKHHPVSRVFLRYMTDLAFEIRREREESWLAGNLNEKNDQCLRGQVIALEAVANAQFDAVQTFFEMKQRERDEAEGSTSENAAG